MGRSQFEEALFTHKSLILGWMKDYALSSEVYKHELSGTLHTGQLGDSQAPQFLKTDGSRQLSGNLGVIDGATIDGVDLSEHAGNASAHHSPVTILDSATIDLSLGGVGGQQLSASVIQSGLDHGSIGGLGDDDHPHYYNHTRLYVEAQSDVSATAVEKVLKSTAAGGLKLKQLDLTYDLTVGNNVLNVDVANWNVGINCVPDAQFDLDVAGNLRAQGWIVGKHALQVKDAVMICHYDGQEPYETDFTGNPTGHMGQVATVTGGVYYRPGKFGKAVIVRLSGTNLCPNPSFEVDYSSWFSNISGTVTTSRITTDSKFGDACMKLEYAADGSGGRFFNANLTAGKTYTYSAWVKQTIGVSVSLLVYRSGTKASVSHTGTGEWTRLSVTYTAAETGTYGFYIWKPTGACETLVDGVLLEQRWFPTPYYDGSFPGGSWSGSEHLSTSTITGGKITYSIPNYERGSFSVWIDVQTGISESNYLTYGQPGSNGFLFRNLGNVIHFQYYNAGTYNAEDVVSISGWHHFVGTWDEDGVKYYIDGVLVDENSVTMTPITNNTLEVGGRSGYAQSAQKIDDFAFFSRVLTADEVRAIYESDAPIFAETSTWSWRTPTNLAWADANGLFARDTDGQDVFGVIGVDGYTFGNMDLNAGDIILGRNVAGKSAIKWSLDDGTFEFYGNGSTDPKVIIDTDGSLINKGGSVRLSDEGITIVGSSSFGYSAAKLKFKSATGYQFGYIEAVSAPTITGLDMVVNLNDDYSNGDIWLQSFAGTYGHAAIMLRTYHATAGETTLEITNYPGYREFNFSGGVINAEDISLSGEIIQPSWTNMTLLNGWVNYGGGYATAKYRKDKQGFVWLEGLIKSGTTYHCATLPAGYRPASNLIFDGVSNGLHCRIDINSIGQITFSGYSNVWVSLSGICFYAEA